MTPDVGLDDDGFAFEEAEVAPADEAADVPLDGDGCPGLGAAPFLLHLLVQRLLHEHLRKCVFIAVESMKERFKRQIHG